MLMLARIGRVGLMLGLVSLPAGCSWGEAAFKQTTTVNAPHVGGSALSVEAHNGAIAVHRAAGSDVSITATLRMRTEERLGQATLVANRNAEGVLEISARPPEGGWKGGEGCAFEIVVPDAEGIRARSSNGRIEIGGLSGLADLSTSNGRIIVNGHEGELRARTSNGRIVAEGVSGPVDADTSNGAVTVRLTHDAAGPVKIHTSNGAVVLALGRGFAGDLDIQTSNGSISVPDSDGAVRVSARKLSRGSASLRVGDGGGESSIRTSNGSVTVTAGE